MSGDTQIKINKNWFVATQVERTKGAIGDVWRYGMLCPV